MTDYYLPVVLLRYGGGTSVWFHRAVSDGESPAHSPLGLTQASISADMDTQTLKTQDGEKKTLL